MVSLCLCFCGGVVVFLWLCSCDGVVVFLSWCLCVGCGCVFMVGWRRRCVFVVVWLCFRGCVFDFFCACVFDVVWCGCVL